MKRIIGMSVMVLFLGIIGCDKNNTASLDDARMATSNQVDVLSIGIEGMENVGDSRTFIYNSSSPSAHLAIGARLEGGSVEITIRNSAGAKVYKNTFRAIAADVVELSNSGTDWEVELEVNNASGNFALTLTTED